MSENKLGVHYTDRDELIERMCSIIEKMSNEELKDLYNRSFGENMIYLTGDEFVQNLYKMDS